MAILRTMTRRAKDMTAGIGTAASTLTVAAGNVRGLMAFAVSKGADPAALAARAGIDPAALHDQDNRIAFPSYVALMRAGQALCGDPALALHYGEAVDLSEVSIVGLIGNASETMLHAFAQLNRYGRLVVEFDGPAERFTLATIDGELWGRDHRGNPNDFPELTETTFARFVSAARRFGLPQLVKALHVTHGAPPHAADYARIFQAPVTFNSDRNAMLLDPACLTFPLQLQPRYVFGVLSERADALLKSLEKSKTARGRVENLLMPILHTGEVGMEAVAAKMGVNRQILFRKLKAEGTTFEQVLDALRHTLALHYLSGKKASVNETVYLVGFSDPAPFSRAFKRWTGSSPRALRAAPPENDADVA